MHITPCLRLICALLFIQLAAGNVEKTIFVAPPPSTVPAENAANDDLGLDRLSPTEFMLRTSLNASFPTDAEPYGSESWFYLEDLNPGQRYEELLSDPSLLPALLNYSSARLSGPSPPASKPDGASPLKPRKAPLHDHHHLHNPFSQNHAEDNHPPQNPLASPQADSVLFLRIYAAADYFTTNTTLMNHVPPVVADIILDPFLLNIFPRSLVPTALYIVVIAVVAYFVGGFLAKSLASIGATALVEREIESSDDSDDNEVVSDPAKKEKKNAEIKKKR